MPASPDPTHPDEQPRTPSDPDRSEAAPPDPARRAQLRAGLESVRARIDAACAAAGRPREDVRLVVVTKFFPASDVALLAGLGVIEVGESRHQEAAPKRAELDELPGLGEPAGAGGERLRWHFIGPLQSNKAAAVAGWADVVESVDRAKLVGPLDRAAGEAGLRRSVLLQVSLDVPGSPGRAGVDPAELPALAEKVAAAEHLSLDGLMAVAPRGADPAPAFARLAEVHAALLARHPGARVLSAGMSGDLEQAVAHGATHLRVGSAILGPRPSHQ